MAPGYRFDRYLLDPQNRQLRQGDAAIELNARYLDALTLLVSEQGQLVSKERFLEEVWRGVPVTDEALTQCIKTLRKALGDDAANPRFIETVPKHGYRFIAAVERIEGEAPAPTARSIPVTPAFDPWLKVVLLGGAGVIGGGVAGLFGGLFYGMVGASEPLQPGMGAVSVLLVLVCLSVVIGLMGGAGVGFGVAAAGLASGRVGPWTVAGAAAGGLLMGGFVKLLGIDAFNLLFGQSPGDITGAGEGALLGGAVGFAVWLANTRSLSLRRSVAVAGAAGAVAGVLIALFGGRLMGGSLDLLAHRFPDSRLELGQIGTLFGERGFGPITQAVVTGCEGALFGVCMVGVMLLARRGLSELARSDT